VESNFTQSPYIRLPFSAHDVQEMDYQSPPSNFIPRQYVQQILDFLQLVSMSNFGKNVLLKVKKGRELNVVPKKRGRGPTKEKNASKSVKISKATAKKTIKLKL
jgi:hypothetical protein